MTAPKLPSNYVLDHVSVSALRTYLMCGYRWAYDEMAKGGDESPGWSARLRGKAVDEAATMHFRLKAANGVGLSEANFVELAVNAHEQGEDVTMFDIAEKRSRDRVARQAALYHSTYGTALAPLSAKDVQKKIRWTSHRVALPVVGVIDVITNTPMVVDTKIKGKVPKEADVHRDLQLTTYAMMTGISDVALAIITDEDRPKSVFIPSYRKPVQTEAMADRYNQMIKGIKARVFNPAPEGSWYCCAKWCNHWNICPHGAATELQREIPGMEE